MIADSCRHNKDSNSSKLYRQSSTEIAKKDCANVFTHTFVFFRLAETHFGEFEIPASYSGNILPYFVHFQLNRRCCGRRRLYATPEVGGRNK